MVHGCSRPPLPAPAPTGPVIVSYSTWIQPSFYFLARLKHDHSTQEPPLRTSLDNLQQGTADTNTRRNRTLARSRHPGPSCAGICSKCETPHSREKSKVDRPSHRRGEGGRRPDEGAQATHDPPAHGDRNLHETGLPFLFQGADPGRRHSDLSSVAGRRRDGLLGRLSHCRGVAAGTR